jgi:hypothetical protein
MKSGTNVIEITDSLPNGDMLRLLGNGWHPRSHTLKLVSDDVVYELKCLDSIKFLHVRLGEFLAAEKKQAKKDEKSG